VRILVVDDSPTLRALLGLHLQRTEGREVEFAEDGREAAEKIRTKGPPDLILLDINMPIMSGLDFLEQRDALGVPRSVPIVVVSTEGERPDVERALAAGAKGYVFKPFTRRELEGAIEAALRT
jgi:CheY-like chemotaxis protein